MLEKILELEKTARQLEPDASMRQELMQKNTAYLESFIRKLPELKAYTKAECPKLADFEISEEGKPIEEMLSIIEDEVDHAGINPASGKHLGYIPGGGLWASAMGDMLAAGSNRYAGISFASPGAVLMENQLIQWLCSLVGYPETSHGNMSSGGSIANLTAITAARDYHKINSTNVKQSVIYFTGQMHHCVLKALHITGLEEAIHRSVPMNEEYQMEVGGLKALMQEDLNKGLQPFLVVASAGTTDTGAVDPLDAIADVCEQFNAWFHVDAAYGGFFLLVDNLKEKFKGIERSDSVVMDPHKGLFLPYGTGVVLVRDVQTLFDAFAHQAAYMVDAYGYDEISPADVSPELSKHFRALRMWLPLHLHGLASFRASLEEKVYLCRYFYEKIAKIGFETGHFPALSVALFRYPAEDRNTFNQKLVAALHQDGRFFFSSTIINGEVWIRCAVFSFRTHLEEIQMALEMVRENVKVLLEEQATI